MLYKKILKIMLAIAFLHSCKNGNEVHISHNSTGHWVDQYHSAIVKFNSNGDIQMLSGPKMLIQKQDFEIIENKKNKKKVILKQFDDREMVLTPANKTDYLASMWRDLNGKEILIHYSHTQDAYRMFTSFKRENEIEHDFRLLPNDSIQIDKIKYGISFSMNFDTLRMTGVEKEITLIRKLWYMLEEFPSVESY